MNALLDRTDNNHCDFQIITGDINIDILKSRYRISMFKYFQRIFVYVSTITEPNREQAKTCIDHIFLKIKEHEKVLPVVLETNMTDGF